MLLVMIIITLENLKKKATLLGKDYESVDKFLELQENDLYIAELKVIFTEKLTFNIMNENLDVFNEGFNELGFFFTDKQKGLSELQRIEIEVNLLREMILSSNDISTGEI